MALKAEYPALLPGGFHALTMEALREQCVASIELSKTRQRLMATIESAVRRIRKANFPADLWIDGSFLTQKLDPSDVDVALIVACHIRTAATAAMRETLKWVESDDTNDRDGLDGYVLTMHPESSRMFPVWQAERDKFLELFGTRYDNVTPKGIVIIKFRGGAKCHS